MVRYLLTVALERLEDPRAKLLDRVVDILYPAGNPRAEVDADMIDDLIFTLDPYVKARFPDRVS